MSSKFFQTMKKDYEKYETNYRKLVEGSNQAINQAKRAIFAGHRGDLKEAKHLLHEAAEKLNGFEAAFLEMPLLRSEGAYRAAVEEFVEASLYLQFLERKTIGAVSDFRELDAELYLGGLSDLAGELVRYATSRATDGDVKEVKRAKDELDLIITFLVSLDLTGYLRTKFDQAKSAARKMEDIAYDLAMRKR